jgi:hypothetical protein
MINYKRIKKDCFWDYNFTNKKISALAHSPNIRENNFLFQKILLNSTNIFSDLKIFNIEKLTYLIENYKVPQFNYNYAFKRKNMAEVYFLDKPVLINELKWID